MTKEQSLKEHQKIAVIGAGMAGVLVANRILASCTQHHITLLDSMPTLGGKSCSINWEEKQWSPHPALISKKLYDFAINSIHSRPHKDTKPEAEFSASHLTLLAQNQITELHSLLNENSKLPKILGGARAQKSWKDLLKSPLFSEIKEEKNSLSKALSPKIKDSLATTFKILSSWNGTSSWQKISSKAFQERNEYCSSLAFNPSLKATYEQLLNNYSEDRLSLLLNERITSASYTKKGWALKTKEKNLTFDKIIVAHSPWEALSWMDRKDIPTVLLKMAFKTKPISLVSLTKKIKQGSEDLPQQMIMPAEQATIRKIEDNLYFTLHLDYESSMDALSVTKALKALRRASTKIVKYFPSLQLENEHIALHPIAWSQSPYYSDSEYINKLSNYNYFSEHLAFCGESYGSSYKPDENIIKSTLACTSHFSSQDKTGPQK